MLSYRIADGSLVSEQAQDSVLRIMTAEEYRQRAGERGGRLLRTIGSIRYSRAEVYAGGVQGVLRFPDKSGKKEPHLALGFRLDREGLTLIESVGRLHDLPERLAGRLPADAGADRVLLLLAEQESEEDILYLQHIESRLEALEEDILAKGGEKAVETLLDCRKKLSELNAHYEQLSALGGVMGEEAGELVRDPAAWQRFGNMMWRLKQYASLLREYAMQLREVWQAQQDARQNRVMSILTVVTTIFLPLTLLTGWYGMNFANMPELRWRYGYPAAIAAAVVIAVAEIVYFKKKKML